MNDAMKILCSSCKRYKAWRTAHRTCDDCRDRRRRQKYSFITDLTVEKAQEIVKYADAGMPDEHLAMALKIPLSVFNNWRERGKNVTDPTNTLYILWWDVNEVRVKRFVEKLEQWRDSTQYQAQKAWMDYAFPNERATLRSNKPANTSIVPDADQDKLPITEVEFV